MKSPLKTSKNSKNRTDSILHRRVSMQKNRNINMIGQGMIGITKEFQFDLIKLETSALRAKNKLFSVRFASEMTSPLHEFNSAIKIIQQNLDNDKKEDDKKEKEDDDTDSSKSSNKSPNFVRNINIKRKSKSTF